MHSYSTCTVILHAHLARRHTWHLPARLYFQLVDVLVPVHSTDVLEAPLPLRLQAGLVGGVPGQVGIGTHLHHILPLQVLVLMATHQVHMVAL